MELILTRLRFTCTALETIELPAYSGSAWRGVLGHGLRGAVCVTRQPRCDDCLLLAQCVYPRLFEALPAGPATSTSVNPARYRAPPPPYVLEVADQQPRAIAPGADLTLGLTLIGSVNAATLPAYLIAALQRAGTRGLGRARGRFAVATLAQERSAGSDDWMPIYRAADGRLHPCQPTTRPPPPCPEQVQLELITPLRLKHRGRLIGPRHLRAADIARALLSRLALLAACHEPQAATPDWAALHRAAAELSLHHPRLRWQDWTRWSSRQGTSMQLGGLLGSVDLAGPALPRLWPLLWLGQWTHLGKGTSFGLGGYRLHRAEPAGPTAAAAADPPQPCRR
ncbi:MAG: CRISPR system precrRNA processing endoribonuclease RAMP protein Cas6 [Chromatiaceae bacterium]|nr:MAG: CRISPR system precrRNA processing endoribonuclease RAMP protein Cas6 [Chromatiaceae bacterium]